MTPPLTHGRRVLVGWCVPLSLLMIGYAAAGIVDAIGLTHYSQTMTLVPQVQALSVDARGGGLRLERSPDGDVHITVHGLYALRAPKITTTTTRAGVTVSGSCPSFAVIACTQNIVIEVPASFQVTARSDGGDISESGLAGNLDLRSSGGDVSADGATGTLTMSSSGGDIDGSNLTAADVTASSSGGDVSLSFVSPPTTVSAVSSGGDVDVRLPGSVAYDVTAESSGGDRSVSVPQDSASTHVVNAHSGGGDVSVRPS